MKDFLKITLAVIVGCLILGIVKSLLLFGFLGTVSLFGSQEPAMPSSAILRIDLSTVQIAEQTEETNILTAISGSQTHTIGILDAVRAIDAAAADPAIKYIYLKPDMVTGGMAEIEELRKALSAGCGALHRRKSRPYAAGYICLSRAADASRR